VSLRGDVDATNLFLDVDGVGPLDVGFFTMPIANGTAAFLALAIEKVGSEYILDFETDMLGLAGSVTCDSHTFEVTAGPPASLMMDAGIPVEVTAGIPFAIQPRIHVVDSGGNVLQHQNQNNYNGLAVSAFVETDPSLSTTTSSSHSDHDAALILPSSQTTVMVEHGVAQFKHLRINNIGQGYRLLFLLIQINEDDGSQRLWTPAILYEMEAESAENTEHTSTTSVQDMRQSTTGENVILSTLSKYCTVGAGWL
jgi:hypothetical protein